MSTLVDVVTGGQQDAHVHIQLAQGLGTGAPVHLGHHQIERRSSGS